MESSTGQPNRAADLVHEVTPSGSLASGGSDADDARGRVGYQDAAAEGGEHREGGSGPAEYRAFRGEEGRGEVPADACGDTPLAKAVEMTEDQAVVAAETAPASRVEKSGGLPVMA